MAGPISYVPTASGSFNVGSHLPHVHHVMKKSCLGGKTRDWVEMVVSDASDSTMFVGFDSEMNKLKSLPAAAVCQAMTQEWQNNITSTFQVKLSKFKLEVRSSRRSMIPKLHCLGILQPLASRPQYLGLENLPIDDGEVHSTKKEALSSIPATLELKQITWDDHASLLEKIVGYEAVHPISNILILES
ncbi:hypothetical protein Bca4012_020177 [Brassica carinata]